MVNKVTCKELLGQRIHYYWSSSKPTKSSICKLCESSKGTNEYDNESKIDRSFDFEGIYIDDSIEEEVGLHVLEAIPKVGVMFQIDQKIQGDDY